MWCHRWKRGYKNVIGKGIELNKAGTDTPLMMETRSACCAVLYPAALCCAVLCCAVLCCAVLCCAASCCILLHPAAFCCVVVISAQLLCLGSVQDPNLYNAVLQHHIGKRQMCSAVSVLTIAIQQAGNCDGVKDRHYIATKCSCSDCM